MCACPTYVCLSVRDREREKREGEREKETERDFEPPALKPKAKLHLVSVVHCFIFSKLPHSSCVNAPEFPPAADSRPAPQ